MKYPLLFLIPFLMFAQGKTTHGSSLMFDGTSSVVYANGLNSYSKNKTALSIGAWIRTTASLNDKMILGWWWVNNFEIRTQYDSSAIFSVNIGAFEKKSSFNKKINDNKWHFLVGVYDSSLASQNEKAFLDGRLQGTINSSGNMPTDESFGIGTLLSAPATPQFLYAFTGTIDNVFIFRRALTATEILWMYNHPEKIYSTDSLKLWLPLSEFTGTVAGDSSGTGNNGTISGATWSFDTPISGGICPKQ